MKATYVILFALSVCYCPAGTRLTFSSGKNGPDYGTLSREFADPPNSCRPGAYWCWLNGDVTDASITLDLAEMKAKGMGRAEIWDVAAIHNPGGAYGVGPTFLGSESVKSIRYALAEGKRLGIKMGIVGSSGWNAGGSWVKPGWAAKGLYHSECNVKGPMLFSDTLPFPAVPALCPKDSHGVPAYFREVAVLAVPDRGGKNIERIDDVRILNTRYDGRTLKWKVPAGKWTVLRFICSNTGQRLIVPSPHSNGLFIDFLDPEATKRHLKYFLERLGISTGNAKSSGLAYFSFDSMELDEGTSWTDSMRSIFYAHNGYDILRYLPVFAGWQVPGGSGTFLDQFHKTVSDQLILSHYVTGRSFLSKYGIELDAEAGGPGPPIWNSCPVEALKALGSVSVPRGEFWVRNRHHIFLVKEIASASHIYGLPLVDAESFTTWRRWKDAPHDLKPLADRAFCEGVNSITIHAFANTRPEFGLPGRAYHAGSDINPTATWWKDARPFMDYLARCSYLLRQGKSKTDIAYYYGDKAPNFFPAVQESPVRPGLKGLSFGYDFDVVNTDVLLHRMAVSRGELTLSDGVHYRLLVIADGKDVPIAVWKRIGEFIAAGGHVLIQDASHMPQKAAKGSLVGMSIDDALRRIDVEKDFDGNSEHLDFIHRSIGDAQIYFICNKTDQDIEENCQFKAVGKQVEVWDPVTGRQYSIKGSEVGKGMTRLALRLPPYGSLFILFSLQTRALPDADCPRPDEIREVKGPWVLSFPNHWGAPDSIRLDSLESWTDYPDSGVNYFSGTACYKKRVFISEGELATDSLIELSLGKVRDVAQVFINGRSAGILWTSPFKMNVRSYLKSGENSIRVEVTNMWINRLTGDMSLPDGRKYCQTNIPPITLDRSDVGDEKYHVQESGILGPVMIDEVRFRGGRP